MHCIAMETLHWGDIYYDGGNFDSISKQYDGTLSWIGSFKLEHCEGARTRLSQAEHRDRSVLAMGQAPRTSSGESFNPRDSSPENTSRSTDPSCRARQGGQHVSSGAPGALQHSVYTCFSPGDEKRLLGALHFYTYLGFGATSNCSPWFFWSQTRSS